MIQKYWNIHVGLVPTWVVIQMSGLKWFFKDRSCAPTCDVYMKYQNDTLTPLTYIHCDILTRTDTQSYCGRHRRTCSFSQLANKLQN